MFIMLIQTKKGLFFCFVFVFYLSVTKRSVLSRDKCRQGVSKILVLPRDKSQKSILKMSVLPKGNCFKTR